MIMIIEHWTFWLEADLYRGSGCAAVRGQSSTTRQQDISGIMDQSGTMNQQIHGVEPLSGSFLYSTRLILWKFVNDIINI